MLSKRGKANGKATAKKAPRAARANRKSKQVRNRPSGMGSASRSQTQRISAPLSTGIVKSKFFGISFGAAARHPDYPEGGLRIAGKLPSSEGVLVESKTYVGAFNTGTNSSMMINPCGSLGENATQQLFATSSPLTVFSQFFRRFKFRKLALEITSEIPPGATTAAAGAGVILQISHETDSVTADALCGTYTMDTAVTSSNCVRFPVWTPEMRCIIINEKSAKGDDQLFWTSSADSSASTLAGDRFSHQGAILGAYSQVNATANLTTSKVLVDFEVDLYGFSNVAAGAIGQIFRDGSRALRAQSRDRGDSKRPVDQPDADLTDFVSLTPRSNRLKVVTAVEPDLLRQFSSAPPSVQGARISSKK